MKKREMKICGSLVVFLLSLMVATGSYAQTSTSVSNGQTTKQDEIISVLKQGKAVFVVISKQGLKQTNFNEEDYPSKFGSFIL